jgi:hypothetical protein
MTVCRILSCVDSRDSSRTAHGHTSRALEIGVNHLPPELT